MPEKTSAPGQPTSKPNFWVRTIKKLGKPDQTVKDQITKK